MDLESVPIVDKDEVLMMLESDGVVVLNVLASQSYNKLHIKGSISAPYDRLENGDFDEIAENKKVIVYCASYSCGASRKAAALLRERGFDASAYEGGMKEWAELGLPTDGSTTPEEYLGK